MAAWCFSIKIPSFWLLWLFASPLQAQEQVRPSDSLKVYVSVEQMPMPKEGFVAFYRNMEKQIHYPLEAYEAGVEGYVFVRFVIDKNGAILAPSIVKGLGHGCDEEVLRVFSALPPWHEGREKGKKVAVQMTLPIVFKKP